MATFKKIIHSLLDWLVNVWASYQNFYFPKKFTWKWKLEMLSKRYEPETTNLFRKIIKPSMVIIDIGAHIGYYTRLFSKLTGNTGQVLSFEPDPDNFRLLKKNTADAKNTKLFNLAISNQEGKISFYKVNNSTGCHSIIPTNNAQKITVPTITIDNFISHQQNLKIDIIKIDIEGAETLALLGMKNLLKNTNNLKIVTELSATAIKAANTTPAQFLNQFNSYGFTLFQILNNGKTKKTSINEINDLLLIKDSINLLAAK